MTEAEVVSTDEAPVKRMLMKWNDTARPYAGDVRLESLIEARAASHPHDIAAVSEDGELTFASLDRLANKLANHLLAAGVGRGDYVIICLERTNAFLISVLAVLKTGAAFIPIEIEEPPSRIAEIATADGVAFAVIEQGVAGSFEALGLYTIVLDLQQLEQSQLSEARPRASLTSDDPAYGIPTSGSSGVPKTVVVAHRPLVNLIEWTALTFGIGPGDTGLWVSPASFDLSIFDLLGLPALGASVRIVPRDKRKDPIACAEMLQREPISFWNSTPALLQTLVPFLPQQDGASSVCKLRLVFLSGDWIPLSLPEQLRSALPKAQVVSLGGATEATIWSNYFPVRDIDPTWTSIPYGRPIQNARYYILGEDLAVCDVNVAGELYIAGDCLAEGYLGDAELTASRFVPDPFAGGAERMYRTGDAARWWPDGMIELLGRLDNQINVRGYRVDLGEVEAALRRCGLSQAVAVAVQGTAGTSRIVAAGVPRQQTSANPTELRAALTRLLPTYMIPDNIRLIESIPLTANGKLDRRAVARLFADSEPSLPDHDRSAAAARSTLTAATLDAFLRGEIKTLRPDLPDHVAGDRPLGEIGLGSLEFALLSGRLFTVFGIRMSPVEFYRGGTLSAVAAIASALAPEPVVAPPTASDPIKAEAVGTDRKAGAAAIVGMSCRVAGLENLHEFWEAVRSGRDCLTASSEDGGRPQQRGRAGRGGFLKHIAAFDAKFFGITPREAEVMDPRQRLLLESAWTAIEHAGEDPSALAGSRTGVFVGATGDDFSRLAHRDSDNLTGHTLTGIAPSLLANRISFAFDLRGPSEVVDTACSSSLVALHRAIRAIASGDCEAAIVGGVSLMLDDATDLSLQRLGMLSPDGACKTFDANANGYARGEGVAVIYLKRVDAAQARANCIYGIVLGSAVNHNGRSASLTAPTPEAQKDVIVQAYRQAAIDPRTVGLIEAHGTGTVLGDPIETRALVDAFAELYREHGLEGGERHCALSAVKANVGHLEAAAGLVGLVKAVLAARFSVVPPIAHFKRLNGYIDLAGSPFYIAGDGGTWPVKAADPDTPRRAGVSSFGFGGTNVHVVLECPPPSSPAPVDAIPPQAIFVSAQDAGTLRVYAEIHASYFAELIKTGTGSGRLIDIGFTSLKGRPTFKHRLVCIVDTLEQACETFRSMIGAADLERVWNAAEGAEWLAETARAWVAGKAADLRVLESRMGWGGASRTAIPTYPFLRTVHWPAWAPRAPERAKGKGQSEAALAPFAALIADHRIEGRVLIPGAVFIHLLADLTRWLTGADAIRLERIKFLGNIASDDVPAALNLRWEESESGYTLAVRAKADGPPLCQAVGAEAKPNSVEYALPTLPPILCRAETVYASLRAHQVELGPTLRAVLKASCDREHCVATLSLPAASAAPAILDGAFQAALYWQLESGQPEALPIPLSIDTLTIHGPLPQSATAIVSAADGGEAAPRITNLTLLDRDGRCCVRVEGFAAVLRSAAPKPVVFAKTLGNVSLVLSPLEREVRSDVPLLVCGCGGLADRLKARGVATRYQPLDDATTEEGDWARLLGGLEGDRDHAALTIILETGLASWNIDLARLAALARAIARRRERSPVQLLAARLVASDGDQDRSIEAAIGAFARCLRIEEPTLMVSVVGLRTPRGGDWSDPDVANAVLRVVSSPSLPPEVVVDCRDGQLLIPYVERIEPAALSQSPFRPGAVYVVTGGLGGLGRLIARDLAGRFGARLMLCGRSSREQAEPRLASLRRPGAEIEYLQADVTVRDEVRTLIDRTRSRFGRIDGVFHAAGVLRDGLVLRLAADDLANVVRPKLLGARYLDLETRDDALDFFVLFSSLAASIGNAGQSGYAFANAWLEGFAGLRAAMVRKGQRSGRTLAVGWGPWRDGGMKIPPRMLDRLREREGLGELQTATGLAALEWALMADRENLLVVGGDAEALGKWVPQRFRSAMPESTAELAKGGAETMRNEELYSNAKTAIVDAIAAESKLRPDEINADTRFEQYGIDSVIIMAVTERLERTFGLLPKTLFFEHQTVQSLSEHLAENYPDKLAPPRNEADGASSRSHRNSSQSARLTEDQAKAKLARPAPVDNDDIAIIGMSGRFPDADDLDGFWRNLREGRDSVSEVPADRWDHRLVVSPGDASVGPASGFRWGAFIQDAFAFDPMFFRMSKREADMIDPQERLFLMSAYHCLEDAGYPSSSVAGSEIGVFAGVMWGQYEMWGLEKGDAASSYGSIANRVSYSFDLKGPSLAVDSMCSSSLTAIHLACASLRSGESTAALAGGVNVNAHPSKHLFLCKRHFAATDGRCHAFGAGGDGYVAGEGVGVIMLKLRSAAERDGDRILGLIRATAINHDGRTSGYTVPNPQAQTSVVRTALSRAGIEPVSLSYVEAHGTGTSLGDPIEVSALAAALQPWDEADRQCAIGSVKSNIGHAESAAGIAGVIKVLLQMHHKSLVPSIHSNPPNPNIAFESTPFRVQRELAPWPARHAVPRRAGVSSFGAGGANAHVILEEWIGTRGIVDASGDEAHLVPLSAASEERLLECVRMLLGALEQAPLDPAKEDPSPRVAVSAANRETVILDVISKTLSLDRRFLNADDRFDEFGLSEPAAATLEANIADALGVALDEVRLADCADPAELARQLDRAKSPAREQLPDIADIAYTLQTGRDAMRSRLAFVARSRKELVELLRKALLERAEDPRIWQGTVARARERTEGGTEQVFLHNLIRNRRLEKLARLWCEGADIDWTALYERGTRRRLSLPGYPFAKLICRVAEPTTLVRGKAGALDPLIDAIDPAKSINSGLTFRKSLSGSVPGVKDCIADGKPSLSPACMLATAMAAARLSGISKTHSLSDASWTGAPPLSADVRDMLVELIPGAAGIYDIRAHLDGNQAEPCFTAVMRPQANDEAEADWRPTGQDSSISPIEPAGGNSAEENEGLQLMDLLQQGLRAAASARQETGPFSGARFERLTLHGKLPRKGRIVVGPWKGAQRLLVLGDDDTPRLSISALQFGDRSIRSAWLPREVVWVRTPEAPESMDATPGTDPDGTSIVLCARHLEEARLALMRQLVAHRVQFVSLEELGQPEDMASAIANTPHVSEILLLIGGGRPVLTPDRLAEADRSALQPLRWLAKALAAVNSKEPCPALRVITVNAHRIGDEEVNPIATAAAALTVALGRELPRARATCVDVALSADGAMQDADVRQALRVLREDRGVRSTAVIRGGQVFRRALRATPPRRPGAAQVFHKEHRCLVIGGSGVVGRRLSEALARKYGAHITWVGRRDSDSDIAAAMAQIEDLGGKLTYVRADATDTDGLRNAFVKVWSQVGPVEAVFHCGLDFSIGRLSTMEEAAFEASVGVKMIGSLNLLEVLEEYPVQQVVLMSSAEAFAGNVGWATYSAACAFQDGLAQAQNGRILSVNWGYWEGSTRGNPATLHVKGVRMLNADEALGALEHALESGLPQLVVFDIGQAALQRMGFVIEPEASPAQQAQPRASAPEIDELPRVETVAAPASPAGAVGARLDGLGREPAVIEALLKDLLGQVLRIAADEIDPERDIVDYGVDSILIIDFFTLVEEAFGRLPVDDLIELPTLREIASYIGTAVGQRATTVPINGKSTLESAIEGDGALPPGITLVDAAVAEDADVALKEYPQRLEEPPPEPRNTSKRNGVGALHFWTVGKNADALIEVASRGSGPPVLFLPGIGLTAPVFHEQFKRLSSDWSLFALHPPGHGRSKAPKSTAISALADTIADTLHQLGLNRPVHIVASCFGTVPAQYLGAHHADLVASLTLCGAVAEDLAVPAIPLEGLSVKEAAALTKAAADSLSADFERLLGVPENAPRREVIESARRLLLNSQRASPAVGMRYLNEILSLRPSEWAPKIAAPTLFITGTCDTVVAPAVSVSIAGKMPNARVLRIANAGHYPFLTHASEFNSELTNFLKSVEH
ncbi:amino acid adenylation domain-containing protein [Bradyrhizobium sp. ISRA442]|uniref:amino acid adenylation domain-containing protein n=1 Tax=Bradyrhizobium sp. ISRA442 TaxID=2866197 RepID=UPI00311B3CC6